MSNHANFYLPKFTDGQIQTWYDTVVANPTGDINSDFRTACVVASGGTAAQALNMSVDDAWKMYITVNQGRTFIGLHPNHYPDISLAGTENNWPAPDSFTPDATCHLTTAQLEGSTGICNNPTTSKIDGFHMTSDGLRCCVANTAMDRLYSYRLGTPFDMNSVTLNSNSKGGLVNPQWPQYVGPGLGTTTDDYAKYQFFNNSDDIEIYQGNANGNIATGDVLLDFVSADPAEDGVLSKSELGFTGTQDGRAWFNEDGSKLYAIGEIGTTETLRAFTMSSAYDVNTASLASTLDISGTITAVGGDMQVSPDESKIYVFATATMYLGTMSTPGDVSTITWTAGTVDYSSRFDTNVHNFHIAYDASKIFWSDETASAPRIYCEDLNF
jgi:hypothetical protein